LRNHFAALWNAFIGAEHQNNDEFIIMLSDVRQLLSDDEPHSFRHIQNDFDAGVAVITAFDYIRNGCPLYLRDSDWDTQRKSIGLYVYKGKFPKFA